MSYRCDVLWFSGVEIKDLLNKNPRNYGIKEVDNQMEIKIWVQPLRVEHPCIISKLKISVRVDSPPALPQRKL